jgi:hypothetical protein
MDASMACSTKKIEVSWRTRSPLEEAVSAAPGIYSRRPRFAKNQLEVLSNWLRRACLAKQEKGSWNSRRKLGLGRMWLVGVMGLRKAREIGFKKVGRV